MRISDWSSDVCSSDLPADNRITEQRRKRIPQMLRVVDGRLAGVKYRSIAEALFPSHKIDSSSWSGDALREITIRLARDGLQLVEGRSEEHTSELQSLMRISYAVFCLQKKNTSQH